MTEHHTISSLKKELFVKIDEKKDYMKTIEYIKKDILDKNMEILGLQKNISAISIRLQSTYEETVKLED